MRVVANVGIVLPDKRVLQHSLAWRHVLIVRLVSILMEAAGLARIVLRQNTQQARVAMNVTSVKQAQFKQAQARWGAMTAKLEKSVSPAQQNVQIVQPENLEWKAKLVFSRGV